MSDKTVNTEETPESSKAASLWTKVKNNRVARIAAPLAGGAIMGAVAVLALAGDEEVVEYEEDSEETIPED